MNTKNDELTVKSSFRLTQDEYDKLKEIAEKEGRTVSNYVRRLIQKEFDKQYVKQF